MRNFCGKKINSILFFVFGIILVIFYSRNIGTLNGINIINDEFGYWGIAAEIAGYDWQELLSTTPYYSYGYSILLVPLYWLKLDAALMYKVAIGYNIVFLLAAYGVSYLFAKTMFSWIDSKILLILCFLISFYTNNYVQIEIAWTESLLYFLVWVYIFLFALYIKKQQKKYILGAIIVALYMYSVHQRCLGILLVTFFMIFIQIIQRRQNYRTIGIILFVSCLFLVLFQFGKQNMIDSFFSDNALVSANTMTGQSEKLFTVFGSWAGFSELVKSVIGKLFYLIATSAFLIVFALEKWICDFIMTVKQTARTKKIVCNGDQEVSFLLLMMFLASFGINAIAMFSSMGRLDMLVYGRYVEFIMGPALLYGMVFLVEKKQKLEHISIYILLFLIGAFIVNRIWIASGSSDFNIICATGFSRYFKDSYSIVSLAYYIALVATGVVLSSCIINHKIIRMAPLFVFSLYWIWLGQDSAISEAHIRSDIQISEIVDIIKESNSDDIYYICCDDAEEGLNDIKRIQYKVYDKTINLMNIEEYSTHIWDNEKNTVLIFSTDAREYVDDLQIIYETRNLAVLKN